MVAAAQPARTEHTSPSTPSGTTAREVLTSGDVSRALRRIAHEILERNKGADDLVLLGIPSRGVPLAQRLGAAMAEVEGAHVPVGSLDVTMHRDDLRHQPVRPLARTDIPPGGIDDKVVVLVDDVLFHGRTIRAALEALAELGRPAHRAARRPRRPRPPRAPDPRRPRREEPADVLLGARPRPPDRGRRRRLGAPSREGTGEPAPAVVGGPEPRRRRDHPRHRRVDARRAEARRQEDPDPARPHHHQPLLRGLHPHPQLVRDRRQVDVRRHHQHHRQGLLDEQGRVAARHGPRPSTPWPSTPWSSGTTRRGACHQVAQWVDAQRHQRRGRHPRAPDPGPARRLRAPQPDRRPRRPARRHRRRPDPLAGVPLQRHHPRPARRARHRRRAADPHAERHRGLVEDRRVRHVAGTSTRCSRAAARTARSTP